MEVSVPKTSTRPAAHPASRRRMRKGTRSCVECRRRKIRCVFSNGFAVCTNCFQVSKECVDQRDQVEPDSSTRSTNHQNGYSTRTRQNLKNTLEVSGAVQLPTVTTGLTEPEVDVSVEETGRNPPLVSILTSDKAIHETNSTDSMSGSFKARKDAICRTLRSALPNYDDITTTLGKNGGWWDSFRKKTRTISQEEVSESLVSFARHAFTSSSPGQLGTLVVAYARSQGNSQRLISLVDNLVVSDFALIGTIDGMECLVLLAKTYTDIGQPRRAWLTWRRGLAIGQLMGLHHINPETPTIRQRLWLAVYHGDRFASLLLGLPHGCRDTHQDPILAPSSKMDAAVRDWMPQFIHQTAVVAGLVIDRNVSTTEPSFSYSVQLDEQLDRIAALTPDDWWNTTDALFKEGTEVGELVDSLLVQFFFFHVRMYIHIPFLKSSSSTPLATMGRLNCIAAARSLLTRYLALRTVYNGEYLFDCKTTDFVGFTAAVTLLISMNSSPWTLGGATESNKGDTTLLNDVEYTLRVLGERDNCKVASQCRQALGLLLRPGDDREASRTISIPYFGKVSRGQPTQIDGEVHPGQNQISSNGQDGLTAASTSSSLASLGTLAQGQDIAYWGLESTSSFSDMNWSMPEDCEDDYSLLFGPDISDWGVDQHVTP